jgi:hypothetical protein
MDALDRMAELAAQEAWAGGDWEARALWRDLPADRRRSLVAYAGGVLDFTGQRDHARLRSALYRRYEDTPRKAMLEWVGDGGDRFRPHSHAIIATDNGDGSQTRRLMRAEYVVRDHAWRARLIKNGKEDEAFAVEVTVQAEWQFYHEGYWRERIESPDPGAFLADGVHYTICEDRPGRAEFKGFGGREASVFYADGRVVHTRNLWFQGPVPPQVREQVEAVVPSAILIWGHHTQIHEPPFHRSVMEGSGCPTCQPVEVPS